MRNAVVLLLCSAVIHGMGSSLVVGQQPNIIVINCDDIDVELLSRKNINVLYPHIRTLAQNGVTFTNFHVTTPLCGPSRASLFRGQYANSTGIKTNQANIDNGNGFDGGMDSYWANGHHTDDWSVWMKDAGYRTMLVGRYLNGNNPQLIPAGWDDFYMTMGNRYFSAFQYTNASNPEGSWSNLGANYRTVAEADIAVNLIEDAAQQSQAFFLYLAPLAAHRGAVIQDSVEPRYQHWWPQTNMPRDPSYDEADFSDKPSHFQVLDRLSDSSKAEFQNEYRLRLLRMKSVDDMIGRLLGTLVDNGQIDNTYVLLTSDNGYMLGHHRTSGKKDPFDRCTRVPLIAWGPNVASGVTADHLLANIDLAPTLLEMVDSQSPPWVDGKSFAALLPDPAAFDPTSWQFAILVENWEQKRVNGHSFPTTYVSLRMHKQRFTLWANGELEYYDLETDPFELENMASDLTSGDIQFMKDVIEDLRQGDPLPSTTIATPFANSEFVKGDFRLRGFAEDNRATSNVRLSVRENVGNFYWNGSSWQPTYTHVNVDWVNPDLPVAEWSYWLRLENTILSSRQLVISARAVDNEGQVASAPFVKRVIWDRDEPETSIAEPAHLERLDGSIVFRGSASDAQAIGEVRLVLRNIDTGLFFDGNEWLTEHVQIPLLLDVDGNWSYAIDLAAGRYGLTARGYDMAANSDKTPDSVAFFVN